LIAVRDRAARRRLDERKGFDRRQMQRLHAQNHGGQRRAQDFRIGEARPRLKIRFVVEPDTYAVRDAPAAARALIRRRLRHRLDLQLLDLVAIRIALHARHAGIDDVTNARHRQRRLRDVGREHDAPRVRRPEHALLLLRGKAREERQDFRVRRMMLAKRLGGVADFALAGQEHEHVAGADAAQFVDGIDDGFHQIAVGSAVVAPGRRALRIFDRLALLFNRPITHVHRI
jgi:hypothetical protein